MAAVETSWKAVGDEVREASGSLQGCEPGQEMANFHGNGSSGLQPEREVSGVRQEEEEAEAGDEGSVDQGGSWEQRWGEGEAETLAVPQRQKRVDFLKACCWLRGTDGLPTPPLPAAGCLPQPAFVVSKSQRWDRWICILFSWQFRATSKTPFGFFV